MSEYLKIDGSTPTRARARAHTPALPSVKRQVFKYKDCGGEAGDSKRMIEGVCKAAFACLESCALAREHLVQEHWL